LIGSRSSVQSTERAHRPHREQRDASGGAHSHACLDLSKLGGAS
jgi:hypothetical protein